MTGFKRDGEPEMVVAVSAVYFQALVAKFHHGDSRFGRRPVVAWDDAGFALVADLRAGRLVRAADNPVFVGLEPAPGAPRAQPRRGRRAAAEDEGAHIARSLDDDVPCPSTVKRTTVRLSDTDSHVRCRRCGKLLSHDLGGGVFGEVEGEERCVDCDPRPSTWTTL